MTTPTHPSIKKIFTGFALSCKQSWHKLNDKIHDFFQQLNHAPITPDPWPPLEELQLSPIDAPKAQTVTATQWALDNAQHDDQRVVLVEVEFFPKDPYNTDSNHTTANFKPKNYTIEGEDPNRRITHYPPSNRLH